MTGDFGLPDDTPHVNPTGGAIAIGHLLRASGARLVTTALNQLEHGRGCYALCTMCTGVGQGIATIIERVDSFGKGTSEMKCGSAPGYSAS